MEVTGGIIPGGGGPTDDQIFKVEKDSKSLERKRKSSYLERRHDRLKKNLENWPEG